MWGMWGMTTIWVVAVVLVLVAAAAGAAAGAFLARRGAPVDDADPDRARRILDERLAAGEIDLPEHTRIRAALENRERSGS
jgi:putative membrane protein